MTNLPKYPLALLTLLLVGQAVAEKKMSAADTQIWEPVLKVVTPDPIPSDAIVLFAGSNTDAWQKSNGDAIEWTVKDGALTVKPKTKSIQSKEKFCDMQLHIEWRAPAYKEGLKGQNQGNSGIFIQGRYELQVLNSFNNPTYVNGQAGAIYKQGIPLVNASKPAEQWQSYDVIYHAPQFNKAGAVTQKARLTVLHNGVLIQDHFELQGRTVNVGHPSYKAHGCAPIVLQDHSDLVSFRNIWVRKL